MNFFDAIRICFGKYVDFSGRAARPEYWYFVLFVFITQFILGIVYRPLAIAFAFAVILPHLAVGARRLHDVDRSGWWLLIGVVPIIGAIVLIIWFCQRETEGPNRFGDPSVFTPPI
jgi:uncharacterized membrane protein YhaH (DUF805 family)